MAGAARRALRASALYVVYDVVQLARHPGGRLLSEVTQIARYLIGLVAGVELVLEPQLAEPRPALTGLDDEVGLADAADGQTIAPTRHRRLPHDSPTCR